MLVIDYTQVSALVYARLTEQCFSPVNLSLSLRIDTPLIFNYIFR